MNYYYSFIINGNYIVTGNRAEAAELLRELFRDLCDHANNSNSVWVWTERNNFPKLDTAAENYYYVYETEIVKSKKSGF